MKVQSLTSSTLLSTFLLALMLPFTACVSAEDSFVEGTHYDVIAPTVRSRSSDKIEVVEFFAYSCGHCYNFEPLIEQWKKTLPEGVVLMPSPAVWSPPMEPHAKAFYAAEALEVLDRLHPALFAAMHVDRKRLSSEGEIREIFVANGVAGEDFDKAYNSFGVGSQVRQAVARAKGAKITGTPEMMVAGKYRISTRKAGSQANMLKIADYLVEKELQASATAATGAE